MSVTIGSVPIKALAFDIFGTVVDWRSGVIRAGQQLSARRGIVVDWAAFAEGWRGHYKPAMDRVRQGAIPWMNLDALHRDTLEQMLVQFGILGLSEEEKDELNRVWHRLDPWPDVLSGLHTMRQHAIITTLSNGNVALLTNMAKRAGLPWDCIFSAELVRRYKPDHAVYHMAAELLGLSPAEVMLVAAHQDDLQAAQQAGLRTAFVPRPLEWGPSRAPTLDPTLVFDLVAADFNDLAVQLAQQEHWPLKA